MASETAQLIAKIVGYTLFVFIIYLSYKYYFKKESKISKPWKIFLWILGIFFSFVGILSLLFLFAALFVPSIPIDLFLGLFLLITSIIFGTLGYLLIQIVRGKWFPKHLK